MRSVKFRKLLNLMALFVLLNAGIPNLSACSINMLEKLIIHLFSKRLHPRQRKKLHSTEQS